MPPRPSRSTTPDPDPAGAADEGAVGDDGTSAWPAGTTGPAVGADPTPSAEETPLAEGEQPTPEPATDEPQEAPAAEPTDLTPEGTTEKVSARVMVSGLWGNRAGTKILQRDELVVVAPDDSRLGEGKPLALVEDEAADPDVASKLAALAAES